MKMARFAIGDSIALERHGLPIRKGTVTKGPFNIDKVDHYHVKWNWSEDSREMKFKNYLEEDLISDITTTKYKYVLL